MKPGVDKRDKLETFRHSLNALVKLNCNASDAYDKGQAAAMLQRLSKEWHQDENRVILTITQMAQGEADARLRFYVQKSWVCLLNRKSLKSDGAISVQTGKRSW